MLCYWILNCLLSCEFFSAFCPHKHTSTQRIPVKWILLYQHRTGHLALQTPMNNSQREAIDERRAGGGGDFKGEEALGKEEEKHRGGIVTIKPAESIVREKLCVCVCFWWYKSAFVLPCADACAPTQSSRARLCCLPLCHLPWGIILKLKQSITAGDAHDRWAQHVQNEFKHPSRLPSWTLQVGTDLSEAVGFTMHLTSWLNPPYIQYSLEFK